MTEFQRIRLEALITEREGIICEREAMLAHNLHVTHNNVPEGLYTDDNFWTLKERLQGVQAQILDLLR